MPVSDLNIRYSENVKALSRLNRLAGKLYRSNPTNKKAISMDISSDDVLHLLQSLNKHEVKYLMVGDLAGVVHGHIRATRDMGFWIKDDSANKSSLFKALTEYNVHEAELLKDAPLVFGLTFIRLGGVGFEVGLGHSLKAFAENDFDQCYARSLRADFEGIPFHVIHLKDLITEKKATARIKDLGDVEELQKIWDRQQSE